MSGTNPSARIQRLVEHIEELPTLPQVALNIIRVVEDPNSSARDIERVLSADPALTAKVLKLVNSAFFGFSQKISSPGHAIVILGFTVVKNLALSLSIIDMFRDAPSGGSGFPKEAFWRHSVASATAAREAAPSVGLDPDLAFVGGLLHDIGKLVIDIYAGETMEQILKRAREGGVPYHEAELEIGVRHSGLGGHLVRHWGLEDRMATGIAFHHEPGATDEPLAALLAFADWLSWDRGFGAGDLGPLEPQDAMRLLGYGPPAIDRYRGFIEAERGAIDEFLGVTKS